MSAELNDRLRRLRREGETRRADPLAELRGRPRVPATRTGGSLAPPTALRVRNGPAGPFAERVRRFPAGHRHGDWSLAEVEAACPLTIARAARDPALERLDLRRAVYLDVETTGLSGGSGTTSFLVALGRFHGGAFELWQGFLRGPEEERAMLAEVAERVGAASGVVSFFGKSFDRHRLEDKMRVHKVTPPFEGRPHLDLYHPLARLYRASVPDGKLQTMERELCGLARPDDLPGSLAPEAWFDFLAGRPHRLEDVFRHNEDDVLSLVVLAAHLGRSLVEERADGRALPGARCARARAWAALCADGREDADALAWIARARERGANDGPLHLLAAGLLRRRGAFEAAEAELTPLAAGTDELALRALIELAKLSEHRRRDPESALVLVERARALSDRLPGLPAAFRGPALEVRARRLRGKRDRSTPGPSGVRVP